MYIYGVSVTTLLRYIKMRESPLSRAALISGALIADVTTTALKLKNALNDPPYLENTGIVGE